MVSPWNRISDVLIVNSGKANSTPEVIYRLLTHEQFTIFQYVGAILVTGISLLGVVTNAINIHVFSRMEQKDGVTVSFLGLSISDIIVAFSNVVYGLSVTLFNVELSFGPMFYVDPFLLRRFSAVGSLMFYTNSILITFFISLVRCLCVVQPIRFRNSFTTKRSIGLIVGCYLFSIASNVGSWASERVVISFNTQMNASRVVRYTTQQFTTLTDILTHTVIPFSTQIVLTACVVIMIRALRKGLKFRAQATGTTKDKTSSHFSEKDVRVIQQVVLLSVIYLVCNFPKILIGPVSSLIPHFKINPLKYAYARMLVCAHLLKRICEALNSSVNIFVYIKYNSKFQAYCKSMFGIVNDKSK